MNLEKFTDRAKGFLQAAQTIAIRMNHQRISPEHIAKALLEDNEGMAAGLIAKSGGDAARAVAGIDALLAKVPAVSGSGAQATPGLDNDAVRLLDQAEQVATKAGDGYVTVERLLLAMVLSPTTPVGKAFADAGVKADALNARSTNCAAAGAPTRQAPKTVMTRSRNSPATSPKSRAKASSTR
jgi:ATP-dependent Clp protease ATP-binding subunit ClpB